MAADFAGAGYYAAHGKKWGENGARSAGGAPVATPGGREIGGRRGAGGKERGATVSGLRAVGRGEGFDEGAGETFAVHSAVGALQSHAAVLNEAVG